MRDKAWLGLALSVLCAVGGCSSGGGEDSLKDLGIDDGASKGVSKSVSVNGDKDVRLTLNTGALVDVPAGAVSKEVKLTLERPADGKALELVEKFKKMQDRIASAPYVLTPHGTKFKEDVTVTLPLAKEGKRELSVAWLEDENDTEWKLLGTAKTDGKKASVVVKHFSVLVIVEEASDLPPVAEIDPSGADAGGDEARDAGAASEAGTGAPDVSLDAGVGATSDGNVSVDSDAARDAGVAPTEASTTSDASGQDGSVVVPPDAGRDATAPSDASVPVTAQYTELLGCGLQTADGGFSPGGLEGLTPYEGSYQLCIHSCYSNVGDCSDQRIYRCNLSTGVFSNALVACIGSCPSPMFYCNGDTSVIVSYCDGVTECPNGEDESSCDPQLFFTCQGTERVAQGARCDGFADCSNAQDEQGCFVCDSATELLPPYKVCNGWYDCQDRSDEPASCAQFMCN